MTIGAVRDRSEKLGLPPGALIFVGEQKTDAVALTVSNYDKDRFEEKQADCIEDCLSCRELPSTTWIHVGGLHNPGIIESLGQCYGIHHLFLEDILNTHQRPKMEELEDGLFVVMKAFTLSAGDETSTAEQLSFILGKKGKGDCCQQQHKENLFHRKWCNILFKDIRCWKKNQGFSVK